MITIRNLREGESLPQHFKTGYEKMPVMGDWCWLAENESGVPVGALLAAPAHGVVYMIRIYSTKEDTSVVAGLLLCCFSDCDKRGFKAFLLHVNPTNEIENKFINICEKWGGFQPTEVQVGLVGPLVRDAWKHLDKSTLRRMVS